jgi:aryl-alcohol dehydrogenase-like predicted oxidoreductase
MFPGTFPIGLGCSRFGSLTGATAEQAREILGHAVAAGVTVVDTANIYGQGQSEQIIGDFEHSERHRFFVITKVGQYLPGGRAFLSPIKAAVRRAARSPIVSRYLRRARAGSLPKNFSPAAIAASVDGSLKRLRRPRVDLLLLHNPTLDDLRNGEASNTLVELKRSGLASSIGVSCESVDVAEEAVACGLFDAIQIPFSLSDRSYLGAASAARQSGLAVIGREVFGGPRPPGQPPLGREQAAETVRRLIAEDCMDILLVGSTNPTRFGRLLDDLSAAPAAAPQTYAARHV